MDERGCAKEQNFCAARVGHAHDIHCDIPSAALLSWIYLLTCLVWLFWPHDQLLLNDLLAGICWLHFPAPVRGSHSGLLQLQHKWCSLDTFSGVILPLVTWEVVCEYRIDNLENKNIWEAWACPMNSQDQRRMKLIWDLMKSVVCTFLDAHTQPLLLQGDQALCVQRRLIKTNTYFQLYGL